MVLDLVGVGVVLDHVGVMQVWVQALWLQYSYRFTPCCCSVVVGSYRFKPCGCGFNTAGAVWIQSLEPHRALEHTLLLIYRGTIQTNKELNLIHSHSFSKLKSEDTEVTKRYLAKAGVAMSRSLDQYVLRECSFENGIKISEKKKTWFTHVSIFPLAQEKLC